MRDSAAIDRPDPILHRSSQMYISYCLLYAAPLLRSGLDFDGYSLLMLALGAVHMQVGGGTHAGWGGGGNCVQGCGSTCAAGGWMIQSGPPAFVPTALTARWGLST